MSLRNNFKGILRKKSNKQTILNQTKENKDVIYGARSIQKQIGLFSRSTVDYDIFTKNPKKSAQVLQKKFDKNIGKNQYYSKPAMYPGTHKVMDKGYDGRKGTKDDIGLVDYSKHPKPKPRVVVINGVRYRSLPQEKKAKLTALKDKTQEFRHKKDREDLNRINLAGGFK